MKFEYDINWNHPMTGNRKISGFIIHPLNTFMTLIKQIKKLITIISTLFQVISPQSFRAIVCAFPSSVRKKDHIIKCSSQIFLFDVNIK